MAAILLFGSPAPAKPAAKLVDAADWISANRISTQFATCLQASGLLPFLSSRGPFTFYVPTDSAFSRLPADDFAALLRPENKDRLQAIVLFHVVNGKKLFAHDLGLLPTVVSCEGSPLPVRKKAGALFIAKARLLQADIRCRNGIIHQVDSVLLPPDLDRIAPLGSTPIPVVAPVPPPVAASDIPSAPSATNNVSAAATLPLGPEPVAEPSPAAIAAPHLAAPATLSPH